MPTYINTNEAISSAKTKGYEATQEDVIYAFVYNITGNKTQSYQITHDCSKLTEDRMRINVNSNHKRQVIEFLCTIMKPVVSNTVREYFLSNTSEFMDLIDSKKSPNLPLPNLGSEFIGDVDELSDEEIKKLASQCVRALPTVLNSGNPDDIKNSISVLATYLKHFVEKKDDEQSTVVVVPEKYKGICPHCNQEY